MDRNYKQNPITVEEIVKDIKKVSEESGIPVQKLSNNVYLANGGQFGSSTVSRKGGWAKIKNTYLPDTEKDLATISKVRKEASYTSKLENVVGTKLNVEELVKEVISKLDVKISPQKKLKKVKSKEKVQVVAMLNDLHYGMLVNPEENDNLNSYDFKEAGRRTALFIKEIADYKPHKLGQVEKLHLILNGDITEGILRGGQGNDQHLLTHQMNGALHILTHAIEYLKKDFNNIEIHCLAGNHDRMVHKNLGQRPTSELFDSYAHIIYFALSSIFKNNKAITFIIPKTPYGFINLPAGRLMYLHGDGLFNRQIGSPGKSINIGNFGAAIREFNAGEISKGNEPIKLVLMGHSHSHCTFSTTDGIEVCIAPSLCGINGFAHMLNINNNLIGQVIFESTSKFIFGDSRLVRLNSADKDSSLDMIIPLYQKDLKWNK